MNSAPMQTAHHGHATRAPARHRTGRRRPTSVHTGPEHPHRLRRTAHDAVRAVRAFGSAAFSVVILGGDEATLTERRGARS
ncbi:hypothetical protein [Streptomyces cacaoi]|uniref:hypothetical protein n=1 Tax=Streptomyces cacaoi TaxID=1898 RepID=UPI0011F13ED2|nr:hypothetical protein [Streptomyces cacaoi]